MAKNNKPKKDEEAEDKIVVEGDIDSQEIDATQYNLGAKEAKESQLPNDRRLVFDSVSREDAVEIPLEYQKGFVIRRLKTEDELKIESDRAERKAKRLAAAKEAEAEA